MSNRVPSAAITRSQQRANPTPPPAAKPWTAAMAVLGLRAPAPAAAEAPPPPRHDEAADGRVLLRARQGVQDLHRHRHAEGVQGIRPIHGEVGHAVFYPEQDLLVADRK